MRRISQYGHLPGHTPHHTHTIWWPPRDILFPIFTRLYFMRFLVPPRLVSWLLFSLSNFVKLLLVLLTFTSRPYSLKIFHCWREFSTNTASQTAKLSTIGMASTVFELLQIWLIIILLVYFIARFLTFIITIYLWSIIIFSRWCMTNFLKAKLFTYLK